MSRSFLIPGETIVKVLGAAQNSGTLIFRSGTGLTSYNMVELGLASEEIKITPKFSHRDIHIDDYGPDVPAEVIWQLAEAKIEMKLIHFDRDILSVCLKNSMGGSVTSAFPQGIIRGGDPALGNRIGLSWGAGIQKPAGTLMGNYLPLTYSGNSYLTLGLECDQAPDDIKYWRFFATYIDNMFEVPLGTKSANLHVQWRVIPYPVRLISGLFSLSTNTSGSTFFPGTAVPTGELLSSGSILWDNPQNITGPDPQFPFYNG